MSTSTIWWVRLGFVLCLFWENSSNLCHFCVCVTSLPKAQQASWEQKPPSTSLERHPESGQVLFSKCGWRRCSCDTNSLSLSSSYWTDAQQKEMMSSFQWISTEARPYIHGRSFLPKSLQPFCCHHPHALWHRPLTSFSSKLFRIPSEAGKNGNACPHLIMWIPLAFLWRMEAGLCISP